MGPEPTRRKKASFGTLMLSAMFGASSPHLQVPLPKSRYRKPRQQKWWSMSLLSLPVMKLLKSENSKIDEARIADLERRVEHKKKLAREHLEAGRDGKANKMANRARANEREIKIIERRA